MKKELEADDCFGRSACLMRLFSDFVHQEAPKLVVECGSWKSQHEREDSALA
jgi:hypothetical protein